MSFREGDSLLLIMKPNSDRYTDISENIERGIENLTVTLNGVKLCSLISFSIFNYSLLLENMV